MTLKQIFIVNTDLKMRKGKLAVQVAHGEVLYMAEVASASMEKQLFGDIEVCIEGMIEKYWDWVKDGLMKKIVLKATQEEMLGLIDIMSSNQTKLDRSKEIKIWFKVVTDKGLTQVPVDSMTCIVVEPLDEEMADHYFGYLKLL